MPRDGRGSLLLLTLPALVPDDSKELVAEQMSSGLRSGRRGVRVLDAGGASAGAGARESSPKPMEKDERETLGSAPAVGSRLVTCSCQQRVSRDQQPPRLEAWNRELKPSPAAASWAKLVVHRRLSARGNGSDSEACPVRWLRRGSVPAALSRGRHGRWPQPYWRASGR